MDHSQLEVISISSRSNYSDVIILVEVCEPKKENCVSQLSRAARDAESDVTADAADFETESCLAIHLSLMHYDDKTKKWRKFAASYKDVKAPSMWSRSDVCSGHVAGEQLACNVGFACQTTSAYCRPLSSSQPQNRANISDRNIFCIDLPSPQSSLPSLKHQCDDRTIALPCKVEFEDVCTMLMSRSSMNIAERKSLLDREAYIDVDELPDLAADSVSDVIDIDVIEKHTATANADRNPCHEDAYFDRLHHHAADSGNDVICTKMHLVVGLERLDDETVSYCSNNSLIVGSAVKCLPSSSGGASCLSSQKLHRKTVIGSHRKRSHRNDCAGSVVSTTVCKKTCAFQPVVSTHLSCSSQSSNSSRHFTDIFAPAYETVKLQSCSSENKTNTDLFSKCNAKLSKSQTSSTALLTKLLNHLQPKSSSSSSDCGSCKSEQTVGKTKGGRRSRSVTCQTRNPSSDSDDSADESEDCQRELALRPPCLLAAPFHAIYAPSIGHTTRAFSDRHTEMVECCLDEGTSFLCNAVLTLRDFTTSRRHPTVQLLRRLLKILMDSTDRGESYHVYNVLNEVRMQHPVNPSELPFTWNDIEAAVSQLQLPLGVYSVPANTALSSALALQYMVGMLEDELFSRSITAQRQVMRSAAYRVLSAETKFSNVKTLLQWISDALHFGQYCEAGINSVLANLRIGTAVDADHDGSDASMSCDTATASDHVPKILPVMQRLLNLVVIVSKCPEDCARRIAVELERQYMHLPTLFQRHLLVMSITSRLLRFKLVQRILEDHYSDDSEQCGGCNSGTICLDDLIMCYFCCVPPQNLFTPPPTPERDEDMDVINIDSSKYSPESCEELSMLLYTVLDSYIAYSRGKLNFAVSRRVQAGVLPTTGPLQGGDVRTLANMAHHVSRLRARLTSLCGEMTPRTNVYLSQMQCLESLVEIVDSPTK